MVQAEALAFNASKEAGFSPGVRFFHLGYTISKKF
jgi:hypothetical protein